MKEHHVELVAAANYYGKHATGAVVLVDGHPHFHGEWKDARQVIKRLKSRRLAK